MWLWYACKKALLALQKKDMAKFNTTLIKFFAQIKRLTTIWVYLLNTHCSEVSNSTVKSSDLLKMLKVGGISSVTRVTVTRVTGLSTH